jgi:hypothetical protein
MKPADIRRLRALINLADKFSETLSDGELRGIVGNWKAFGELSLRQLVNEFHDWQCRRLGEAEEAAAREERRRDGTGAAP